MKWSTQHSPSYSNHSNHPEMKTCNWDTWGYRGAPLYLAAKMIVESLRMLTSSTLCVCARGREEKKKIVTLLNTWTADATNISHWLLMVHAVHAHCAKPAVFSTVQTRLSKPLWPAPKSKCSDKPKVRIIKSIFDVRLYNKYSGTPLFRTA